MRSLAIATCILLGLTNLVGAAGASYTGKKGIVVEQEEITARNPRPVRERGEPSIFYGTRCVLLTDGLVEVVYSFPEEDVLIRYTRTQDTAPAHGIQCLTGTLFYASANWISSAAREKERQSSLQRLLKE